MVKKLFLLLFFSFLSVCAADIPDFDSSPYFNTKFLVQYDEVCRTLIEEEGFVEGFFSAEDKVAINYIWLKRPNARYTVLFCSGFWPGRKEGLATFYEMLPKDCNLLFFDARGHGASKGRCLSTLWRYGSDEYKDVVGAVRWAHKQQQCPIIIYGVCAGAFHAAHALLRMQACGILNRYQVKGLLFDSGWSSIATACRTACSCKLNEFARKKIKSWFTNDQMIYAPVRKTIEGCVNIAHFCIARPVIYCCNNDLDLIDKVGKLEVPIFYIHAEGDEYAQIDPVKQLARKTKRATCWWISENSKHACHQLKLKEQYHARLLDFIKSCLG